MTDSTARLGSGETSLTLDTADEIRELARERDIRWLIVKQELQIEEEQVKQFKDKLMESLEEDFERVESLDNYEVYRRKEPEDKADRE